MVHSIQNNKPQQVRAEQTTNTRLHKKEDANSENSAVINRDQVALTIKTLQKDILSAPEINQARIEFLQKELASGRYEVNSLVVAKKLLSEWNKIT